MNIIGQTRAIRELLSYARAVANGQNFNILITGPSGHGKTTLAHWFAYEALGHSWDDFLFSFPPHFPYSAKKRLIFLDEVHELGSPEMIYPFMDAGTQTFVIATNQTGDVKTPLLNRCITIELDRYTSAEMILIVKGFIPADLGLGDPCIAKIAHLAGGNPRIAKVMTQRIVNVLKELGVPNTVEELVDILEDVLNINGDGLSPSERRYMDSLRSNGGKASLQLLTSMTGLNSSTLTRDIEPKLISMGLIEISSRGRIIKGNRENEVFNLI